MTDVVRAQSALPAGREPVVVPRARVIAFYLPQFHPIPENDEWWGAGFTEWRNVAKARPLFRGHYQPHVPGDLGFYDLRVPEVRAAQAEMAQSCGIEGFCYWHYWFGGRRILERPFNEVVATGEPDFPFCIGWANQTWTGIWHGLSNKILVQQTYPGRSDYEAHFRAILPALTDPRYITVDRRPLVYVYDPANLPEGREFTDTWRELAHREGFPGLYFVGEAQVPWNPASKGLDAMVDKRMLPIVQWAPLTDPIGRWKWERKRRFGRPTVYQYGDVWERLVTPPVPDLPNVVRHARLMPNWDNSPRSGANALVLDGCTPDLFRRQVKVVLNQVHDQPVDRRLVFLKSWNEWAEGNYVEPDLKFGRGYLDVLREELLG